MSDSPPLHQSNSPSYSFAHIPQALAFFPYKLGLQTVSIPFQTPKIVFQIEKIVFQIALAHFQTSQMPFQTPKIEFQTDKIEFFSDGFPIQTPVWAFLISRVACSAFRTSAMDSAIPLITRSTFRRASFTSPNTLSRSAVACFARLLSK